MVNCFTLPNLVTLLNIFTMVASWSEHAAILLLWLLLKHATPKSLRSLLFLSLILELMDFFPPQTAHYNKTCLLQLGFSTSASEKTRTLLPWKTTSHFGQAVKCVRSHVRQDIPNGHVPNGSEVWVLHVLYFIKSCPTSLRLVNISKIRHTSI